MSTQSPRPPARQPRVCLGNVTLQAGRPAIIVPLTASQDGELLAQARRVNRSSADIVEWRCDRYAGLENSATVIALAGRLREVLAPRPVLFTVRSRREGGESRINDEATRDLIADVCQAHVVDAVDVEYRGPAARRTMEAAQAAGVLVIGSNHDFHGTPSAQEMVDRLDAMEAMGADVCKLSVMPHDPKDVARLFLATATRIEQSRTPLITIAMGRLGMISRLGGQAFGSCATFAVADEASAPGQLPIGLVAQVLDLLYGSTAD